MKRVYKQLGLPLLGLSFLFASASCAASQRQQFSISMRSVSDDGQLLAGVHIYHGEQELGTTRENGVLEVNVEASSGSSFDVRFECPDGYQAIRDRVVVPLRHVMEVSQSQVNRATSNALALTLKCRPDERKAIIVVKARRRPTS